MRAKSGGQTQYATGVSPVRVGSYRAGDGCELLVIAGPCVIESEESALRHAEFLSAVARRTGTQLIFKASYDKANRTSIRSYRGPGVKKGARILAAIRKRTGLPVLTDVHSPEEAEIAGAVVDVVQIPAFLCRQTDLLIAAAKSKAAVNVKKAQFLAPEDMKQVVEKMRDSGKKEVFLTERGTTFGYRTLVNDFKSIPIMRELGCPVIFDATHSVQRPGGLGHASGGDRRFAPALAQSAIVMGADGIFMEVHENPDRALSDGPNSLPLDWVEPLLLKFKVLAGLSCRSIEPPHSLAPHHSGRKS